MVLKPTEIFKVSKKYSVLILDNSRDQTKYWQGLREQEEGIMPSANDITKIEHLGIPYFFKWFRRQSYKVCNKEIGRLYASGKFDFADNDSLIILVFDRSFKTRRKKLIPKLVGFIACNVNEEDVMIDLVCAKLRGLGTALIKYIIRYAQNYNKLNIKLDAATIELACKFYPRFGFLLSEADEEYEERCEGSEINKEGLDPNKIFKMEKILGKNVHKEVIRQQSVAMRTRAATKKKKQILNNIRYMTRGVTRRLQAPTKAQTLKLRLQETRASNKPRTRTRTTRK